MTTMTATTTIAPGPRSQPLRDSLTMLRRNLRHMRRYPSMTGILIGQPIVFLLLFVYVFGNTLGRGLPGSAGGGRREYLTYITPAIVVMAVASVALGTSVSVAMDMTSGIVDRFRTMAIARVSILTGHVAGALIQTAGAVAVAFGVAVAMGFRSDASLPDWLTLVALLALFAFGLTWLTVALGLAAKSPESASNTPLLLVLLPFLGSGFVPTDSMPVGLRWFAQYQPFTPMMNSVRGLLDRDVHGGDVLQTCAWSVGLAAVAYLWARRLYNTHETS